MQITLITVGTLKESYLRDACAEYTARLAPLCTFTEVNLREERIPNEDDPHAVSEALSREGEKILAACPKGSAVVALCIEGKELSSEEFAAAVGTYGYECGKIAFVIGSSHGLSPAVKAYTTLVLISSPAFRML